MLQQPYSKRKYNISRTYMDIRKRSSIGLTKKSKQETNL